MVHGTTAAKSARRDDRRMRLSRLAFVLTLAFALGHGAPVRAGDEGPGCDIATNAILPGAPLEAVTRHLAAGEPVTVLAIGSSSTEGVGATAPGASYPAQLEGDLRALWGTAQVSVRNAGVGGETADATVARLEAALAGSSRPDLVIWQVGTNDAVRGGDEAAFRALLERGVAAARRAGADLILLDQQFYPGIPDRARYERYVAMVAAVASTSKAPLFSRYRLMKKWSDLAPGLLSAMLAKDGFHMGDRGYDCLASALSQEITTYLRTASPAASAVLAKRPATQNVASARRF
jgi:acyl-CoA thioesterase-1